MLVVIGNVLLSWLVHSTQNITVHQIYRFTGQFVDPLLQPIRKLLNPMSRNIGIDFSPIVLIVLLNILNKWLVS